jgi:hypothetical protein
VVATETLVVAILGDDEIVDCVFLRCGDERSYAFASLWESSPLILFGSVLLVRVLFLVGEHALLLRVIAYYRRVHVTLEVPVAQSVSSMDSPGVVLVRTSTINFTDKVRDLLRGDRRSTWTSYAMIMSVFVQIIFWFSPDPLSHGRSYRF